MGVVSGIVNSAQNQLNGVAASSFGDLVSNLSGAFATAATLSIIVLCVNMFFQVRPMGPGEAMTHLIKLMIIVTIGLKWAEFSKISMAVEGSIDHISQILMGSFGGSEVSGQGLAGSMDDFIRKFGFKGNEVLKAMGWLGGAIMGIFIACCISLIGAATSLVLIFAKIMVTIYIGIAPIFIATSMFQSTSEYFRKWLQGTIHYMLYPLVIAVIFSSFIRIIGGYVDSFDTSSSQSISDFVPLLTCLIIMAAVIIFIPMIVSSLSGMIGGASPFAAAAAVLTLGKSAMRQNRTLNNTLGSLNSNIKNMAGGGGNGAPKQGYMTPDYGKAIKMFNRAQRLEKKM